MTRPGVAAARDALLDRETGLAQSMITLAQVTAVPARQVTVLLPGGTTPQTWPRTRAYGDAAVGDVAVLVGRPGSWVALGALA